MSSIFACPCQKCKDHRLNSKRDKPVAKFETGYPIIIWSKSMGEQQAEIDSHQRRAINFFKVCRYHFLLLDIDEIDDFRFLLMNCGPAQRDAELIDRLSSHQLPIVLLDDEVVCAGASVYEYFNWLEQLKYEQCFDTYIESRLLTRPPQLRIPLRGDFHEFFPVMQVYSVSSLNLNPSVFEAKGLESAYRFMKLRFLEVLRPPPIVEIDEYLDNPIKTYVAAGGLSARQTWKIDDWSYNERCIRKLAFAAPLHVQTDDPNVAMLQHRFRSPTVQIGNSSCYLQIRGAAPAEDSGVRQVIIELCFADPLGDVLVEATVMAAIHADQSAVNPTAISLGIFDLEEFLEQAQPFFTATRELHIPWSVEVCARTDGQVGQWLRGQLETESRRGKSLGVRCLEVLIQSEPLLHLVPPHLFEHYQMEILSQRTLLDQPRFFCHSEYLSSVRANFGGDWVQHVLADLFLAPPTTPP